MIAKEDHSENTSLKIHKISYEVSKLIIEENLRDNKARIYEYLELLMKEVASMHRANSLEENVDAAATDLPIFLKDLEIC